jgi:hypothetical protein
MLQIAKHAAKNGGKVGKLTIRSTATGKTARLSPTAARPANPDGKGTRPPVAKAMGANTMSGSDGGFLVPEGVAKRRRKKRARACVQRVLKALDAEG